MKSQSNKVQSACDVKIYSDKGSLALRFPLRHSALWELLDGKSLKGKPKCLGIGKYGFSADEPDDWKRATTIASQIEADLDHPEWDKLFDRTLAKYGLGGGKYAKLADIIQLPGTVQSLPEITVGAMWEEYLLWKKPQLQPTTFSIAFLRTYTNIIKGLIWHKASRTFSQQTSIWDKAITSTTVLTDVILSHPATGINKRRTLNALSEAFTRLQSQGKTKLTVNPFVIIAGVAENKTDMYKSTVNADGFIDLRWWDKNDTEANSEENDRRAFTKVDRDTIIKVFYTHKRESARQLAPLVEFRFLTGCRNGEAFALEWKDVFLGRNGEYLRFSKSYNGTLKNNQVTKTGEIRLFKMYPKLNDLLLRIKPVDAKPNDLVFTKLNGKHWDTGSVSQIWSYSKKSEKQEIYSYPGVVTQLANDGLIDGYLPFYNCRHTFISLMAHAGTDLLLLATACGNSVEVIQRHYLGVNTDAQFPDI